MSIDLKKKIFKITDDSTKSLYSFEDIVRNNINSYFTTFYEYCKDNTLAYLAIYVSHSFSITHSTYVYEAIYPLNVLKIEDFRKVYENEIKIIKKKMKRIDNINKLLEI